MSLTGVDAGSISILCITILPIKEVAMKIKRNSKGFTLIELLIVVAIIGILAAIAIPNYMSYTKKAKMGEVVHAMGAIKNAVVVYYSETGNTMAAADAAAIKTAYGVDVPVGKATFAYTTSAADSGTITATPSFGVDGTLSLAGSNGFKTWVWSGTGMDATYVPKN
jgi:type IV pilus assembly protein PilA